MEPGVVGRLITLVILLLLSAFFSSAETAFMSVNKLRVRADADEGSSRARLILSLLDNTDKLLTTILVGNNLVNIVASSLTTTLMIDLFGSKAVGIATGILTLLILIFGEITPKTIASRKAEQMADRIRAAMREGTARQQKLRELYETRDQRYREIDARAEAYLNGYREKFTLPDLAGR